MEVPHQSIKQMKDKQNEICYGRSTPVHSTSGNKRRLGMAPQFAAKQSHIPTKPSSRFYMYMSDREMGEGAKNLSPQEIAALELDIFKPLDFYEILFSRLKGSDKGKIISNINEL